jgi:hypothetical protein
MMALVLVCDGCGVQSWDRADMLEASFPDRTFTMTGIAQPFEFTPMQLGWVGPCCAELANDWQPGDPETRD